MGNSKKAQNQKTKQKTDEGIINQKAPKAAASAVAKTGANQIVKTGTKTALKAIGKEIVRRGSYLATGAAVGSGAGPIGTGAGLIAGAIAGEMTSPKESARDPKEQAAWEKKQAKLKKAKDEANKKRYAKFQQARNNHDPQTLRQEAMKQDRARFEKNQQAKAKKRTEDYNALRGRPEIIIPDDF